tara:strand:- start:1720 stop:1938 length:219 start_codon:yes stop_codon:yes gene_type:complete
LPKLLENTLEFKEILNIINEQIAMLHNELDRSLLDQNSNIEYLAVKRLAYKELIDVFEPNLTIIKRRFLWKL